jgi:hypothetical protein
VAEVAARFTLDAMPGKQMAIDADLNAGLIDQAEAKRRRRAIEMEADFYGAMDGASKFVKGDAIAAILIILINIIGGFAVGFLRGQGDAMTVLQTYTLLTVGEGLVAQIPALLISTAAGLLVTRASTEQAMGQDVVGQVLQYPRVLMAAGAALAFLSLVPGFPKPQFLLIGAALFGLGYLATRVNLLPPPPEPEQPEETAAPPPTGPEAVLPMLKVDAIELEIGYGLMSLVDPNQKGDLLERIAAIRRQLATDLGFVMPSVRVRDNVRLRPLQYQIKIRGETVAQAEAQPRLLLAMPPSADSPPIEGMATTEPVFGMRAYWIEPSLREQAQRLGYTVVEPTAVVATHLTEIVRRYAAELLGRAETQQLLDNLKEHNPVVVQEVVPDLLTLGEVQKVLQHLLREGVPIRDLETILETLGDHAGRTRDVEALGEYARAALSRTITHRLQSPRRQTAPDGVRACAGGVLARARGADPARRRVGVRHGDQSRPAARHHPARPADDRAGLPACAGVRGQPAPAHPQTARRGTAPTACDCLPRDCAEHKHRNRGANRPRGGAKRGDRSGVGQRPSIQHGDLLRFAHGVARVQHRLVRHNLAVAEADDALGMLGNIGLVRHQHNRAPFAVEPLEDCHNLLAGAGVEVARRLVRQNQHGVGDDGAGNRDALLLPARQFVRLVVDALRQPDHLQRAFGAFGTIPRACIQERQLHIAQRSDSRQQVEGLKHKADVAVANLRQLRVAHRADQLAVEVILAVGGAV